MSYGKVEILSSIRNVSEATLKHYIEPQGY